MRSLNENYAEKLAEAVKRPLAVVQIAFDDAETDLIYLRTSADAPVPNGATVYTILTTDPTAITQKIDPLKGTATIGHASFTAIDPGGALTTKINEKLGNNRGLRGKLVRFYRGFEGLSWSDMEPQITQIIKSASFEPDTGQYKFACEDIQRSLKKNIFDKDTCVLSKTITAEQTHIPVIIPSTSGVFNLVEHDAAYLERPSETVAFIKINKEVICHLGFFTHATDGVSLLVATNGRGTLNTTASAHEIDASASDDRQVEVSEWVYFEGAIPKIVYAILTGNSIGESADFPWSMDIDTSLVRQSDFTDIGDDLWNTNTDFGQMCRFENPKPQDAKKFIETELMMLLPGFMPVYASGELGLKRMTGVISDAAHVAHLTNSTITKLSSLTHDMPNTVNKYRVDWNYNASTDKPTKHTIMIDGDSINTHGDTKLKTLKFRGLHTGRHTDETLRNQFNALRSRHAGPPLLHKLDTFLFNEALEIGDAIRVTTDKIRDWNNGDTLDQVFEIQQIAHKPTGVSLTLFGSSAKAGAIDNGPDAARLPDSYYTGSGTDLNTVLSISGNAVTSDDNLPSGVYYYDGDLTINSSTDITINGTVTLKIKGHLQINGTLNGKGRGNAGGNGQTSTSAQPTVSTGYFGATRNGNGVMFEDAYDHGAIFSDVINSPIATKGKNYSIPALSLDLEDGVFTGVPTDVAGTAGRGGSAALFKNRAGDISQIGDGGDGGDGGAGLIIISRGLSFGPSADIDVSGDDGNIGEEVSQFIDYGADEHGDIERTYYWWSGSGAGGSPGAVIALIDGNDTPPALSNYVTANLGNSPLSNGNYQIPAGGKKFALTYDESYKIFSWNQGYAQTSMVKACTSVQYVPADQTVQEETDQLHQLDPPDSVTATVYTGEAVTITSAGNRMQPVQIAWSQNTDPDCIGYEVRAKRTADSNYRTVILTRSSSEVRGHYNQQQADEYSIQVRCISKSEQHSDWASITYTAAVTNDTITTIGAFVQAPFPVRYVPNRITCALDNSTGNNGFYEIARQRITAPYNSFSFDGIVSIGSSGGRYHEQSRVNLSFIVTSPAIQIAKVAFEYSGFDCSSRLRLTYEDNGDGTYTVHVYAFLTSWASLMMSGDWTINSDLSQGWITSYFPVAEGTTDAVVGTAVTATANYEDGATVGGQLGSNLTDESGAVASDLHVLNANQSWGDVEGQRYTHSPVIGTTRHLMFKSENPHLYSSPLNTWVELVAVQLPRYGNILVMFRTEFGVYEGRTDTVVNWEWTINGLTQSSVTYTYTPEQFYNISFVANNISAGDVIRISAKIDETQGLPAPTNLPTFDYIEVYSDVTFGIMEI